MASSTAEKILPALDQPLGMFIDGEFTEAQSSSTFDILNPATEEVIAQVAEGGPEDIELAVSAAHKGFEALRDMGARKRGRLLLDLARAIEDRFEEFAQLDEGFCDWKRSGSTDDCSTTDLNRSAFVTWVDCTL